MYYNQMNGIAMLADAIRNKQIERQTANDAKSMMGLLGWTPNVEAQQTTFNVPDNTGQAVQQKATQGLLGQGMLGNTNFAPEMQPNNYNFNNTLTGGQQPTMAQPTPQLTNPMDKYSKENNPVTSTTKTLSLKEQQNEFNKQWAAKVQEMKLSGQGLAKFMPMLLQQRKEGLAQLQSDYKQQALVAALDELNGNPNMSAKEVFQRASRLKALGYEINPKEFWEVYKDPNLHFTNAGDRIVGLHPQTGQEVSSTAIGVSPTAVYNKNTVGADTVYKVNNAPQKGGNDKEYSKKWQQYKWASGYDIVPTGETGMDGKPIYNRVQRNPQLAKQLEGELFTNGQGGGQQQAANNNEAAASYDRVWRQIKSENPSMSDEDVTGYLTYIIQQNGG